MAIALFVILFLYLLYHIFRKKKNVAPPSSLVQTVSPPTYPQPIQAEANPGWIVQHHTRLRQRKTYIKGILLAKFHGELDYIKDLQQFVRERYFDITLYDARIEDAQFRKNNDGPFPESREEENFPGPIEPNPLPCSISYQGITGKYAVLLHNVKLSDIDLDKYRILHMEEDDLVFGTIAATITGHILEDFREEYQVKIPVTKLEMKDVGRALPVIPKSAHVSQPLVEFTGKTKTESGYRWQEFRNTTQKSTWWGNPVYTRPDQKGCLGIIGFLFLLFFAIIFLAAIGPQGIYVLLVLAVFSLVAVFFSALFRPILWLLTAIVLIIGVASLIRVVIHGSDMLATPFSHDQSNEVSFVVQGKTIGKDPAKRGTFDSLIVHHRVWKDYAGNSYDGNIWVRTSDLAKSGEYKNRLQLPQDPLIAYDWMLNALQANDRSLLPGVYGLLDSVRILHRLDAIAFAKVVVSFVQDIPYALILDRDCNPDLYNDAFTRSYLKTRDALCSGFQRFGINTPVEFMGTLKGDCDTRTLLLYTLLSHYNYDVAILSSEVYSHSLLGIVLPVPGIAYTFHNKSYVLWETTTPQMPPGLITHPYNNLSNWRISLTSNNYP
ncbi:MAG TPA: hypothetical protein VGM30_17150 [Puia sp.]|jgi:energy-coupling factor transporter transmembrane protein EcfT